MIRAFEDIEEFKDVTGFKLGDVIHLHCTARDGEHDFVGQFTGYETIDDGLDGKTFLFIGASVFSLEILVSYKYLTKEGKLIPFGIKTKSTNDYTFKVGAYFKSLFCAHKIIGRYFDIDKKKDCFVDDEHHIHLIEIDEYEDEYFEDSSQKSFYAKDCLYKDKELTTKFYE